MNHFWYICHICAWRTFARMLGKYRIIHHMRSNFSTVWRTCFTIPCCVSLLVINPFSIFKSENVSNFPFPERYLCCIWNFMLTIIEGEIRPCLKDICDLVTRTCGHLDLDVKWTVWLWFSSVQFSSVQSLSRIWLFETPWTTACLASLSITNSQSPHKPMSIESVMPSNHLVLCCPLLLLPPIPPCIRLFSNEPALRIRWPKYWSFSFILSPSNEHSGLISFTMD